MRVPQPHPGAALGVATLALITAVSGTAVAVVSAQNGDRLIAKHTLSGNRLRADTVTGNQVAESTLKTVPSANRAAHLPPLGWHNLSLLNGWTDYNDPGREPAYAVDAQGIVHLRGAILQQAGSSANFARLPPRLRPSSEVWLATDLFDAAPGRIEIETAGFMFAEAFGSFVDAQDFTNLDGLTWSLE
jgi:hypothetical protein